MRSIARRVSSGPPLAGLPVLQSQLPVRIRSDQRLEICPAQRQCRVLVVNRDDIHRHQTVALVVSHRRRDAVTSPQPILAYQGHRHEGVVEVNQVAVLWAAYESGVALYVDPPSCFTIYRNRTDRGAWCIVKRPVTAIIAPSGKLVVMLLRLSHWSGGLATPLLLLIAVVTVGSISVSESTALAAALSVVALIVKPLSFTTFG